MQVGVALVSHLRPDWQTVQLPLVARMRAEVARVPIAPEFGNPPGVASDLIARGVTTIVLNTGNPVTGQALAPLVDSQFIDGGWLEWTRANPRTAVVLEIGNEPDYEQPGSPCLDVERLRRELLATLPRLRAVASTLPNLSIAVSAPVDDPAYAARLFTPDLVALCDAICPHMYGGQTLGDGAAATMTAIYRWLLANTSRPLWITECGINGQITTREKGRRIISWLAEQPPQVRGACVFTISDDPAWAAYAIDGDMADALGQRINGAVPPAVPAQVVTKPQLAAVRTPGDGVGRWFPETGYSLSGRFRQYWERFGGLATFGYPISDELAEAGEDGVVRTTLYTERAVLEWHPGAWADRLDIMERRVGVSEYERRYGPWRPRG